jgi:hypothetical protein
VLPGPLGLGTTDQLLPSQDSIRLLLRVWENRYEPTAVQSVADTHDTPSRLIKEP